MARRWCLGRPGQQVQVEGTHLLYTYTYISGLTSTLSGRQYNGSPPLRPPRTARSSARRSSKACHWTEKQGKEPELDRAGEGRVVQKSLTRAGSYENSGMRQLSGHGEKWHADDIVHGAEGELSPYFRSNSNASTLAGAGCSCPC